MERPTTRRLELPDFSRSRSSSPQVAALSAIRRLKRLLLLLLVLQVGTAVVLLQLATREVLPFCLQAPKQEEPSEASSLAGSPRGDGWFDLGAHQTQVVRS